VYNLLQQVSDGYFVHFFAPEDLSPLRKHVTFVLDVSGSMEGRKIYQLKEAMYTILHALRPADFFSLAIFESRTKVSNREPGTNQPPTKKLTKGGVLRRALGIVPC
jgi:hypothetical protein